MSWRVIQDDCIAAMAAMADKSVDAIVTDPPYGLGFMGKAWDDLPPGVEWAAQCLRVLKPGGHLLAFGGTRTYHRLACAVEDAGFEIRDTIAWLYGSGFPKSLDVSKAIDKRPGVSNHRAFASHLAAAREIKGLSRADVSQHVVGTRSGACWNWEHHQFPKAKWWPALRDLLVLSDEWTPIIAEAERKKISSGTSGATAIWSDGGMGEFDVTAPATPEAQQWAGWGTALKPAHEPIVVARKPLTGTVAACVLAHGTGALNVDGCRIGMSDEDRAVVDTRSGAGYGTGVTVGAHQGRDEGERFTSASAGRWPANVVLSHSPGCEAVGTRRVKNTSGSVSGNEPNAVTADVYADRERVPFARHADPDGTEGVAAYRCVEDCPVRLLDQQTGTLTSNSGTAFTRNGRSAYGTFDGNDAPGFYGDSGGASRFLYVAKASSAERNAGGKNTHPTVKPIALMRWLVRLVTPPGGLVLDPFAGSGTTGIAAMREGFSFVGIEREVEYAALARERIIADCPLHNMAAEAA